MQEHHLLWFKLFFRIFGRDNNMSKAAELAKFIGNGTHVGTGAAEDKKILFDGNAQDFHIGLDDSSDSLTLGLGSTLGTTTHMRFDPTGAVTKPLQPCFYSISGTVTQSGEISTGD